MLREEPRLFRGKSPLNWSQGRGDYKVRERNPEEKEMFTQGGAGIVGRVGAALAWVLE